MIRKTNVANTDAYEGFVNVNYGKMVFCCQKPLSVNCIISSRWFIKSYILRFEVCFVEHPFSKEHILFLGLALTAACRTIWLIGRSCLSPRLKQSQMHFWKWWKHVCVTSPTVIGSKHGQAWPKVLHSSITLRSNPGPLLCSAVSVSRQTVTSTY